MPTKPISISGPLAVSRIRCVRKWYAQQADRRFRPQLPEQPESTELFIQQLQQVVKLDRRFKPELP